VKESLAEHTLDYKLEHHRLKPSMDALVKEEERIANRIREILKKMDPVRERLKLAKTPNAQETARKIMSNMEADLALRQRMQNSVKARIYALQMEMLRDVVAKADVVRFFLCASIMSHLAQICTTCITSASAALNVVDFPVVFLDEASMSTEPASLIPIMKGVGASVIELEIHL
jgi:superfamily I DNA and/or RNA helicase